MTIRADKMQATREKLLQTTDRLITERGFENVSVADITQACGIAKGTFYNYFSKKEAIFEEISRLHFEQLDQLTATIATDANAVQTISHYLTTYLTIITDSGIARARDWIRFVAIPSPEPNKWQFDLAKLTTLLQQLVRKNRLKTTTPITALANLLATYLYGLVFSWGMSTDVDPQQTLREFCVQTLPLILQPYL